MPGGPSLRPSPSALALRPTAEPGAGVRRFRPPPAAPPQRAPSGRGAAALGAAPPPAGGSAVPRPVPPGSSRQPTSREGGERRRGGRRERGEGGRREKGSCSEPGPPRASQERALGGSPGPRRPAPPSRSSRGTPRPSFQQLLRPRRRPPPSPSRPHPQLCGLTPGTRVLAPSFLPSCLPSRPPARPRSPSRVAIVSVPSALRRRLALRRLPLALPESPAAAAPTPARGVRGREKWASAPSPSPAPQPCPAREDREDEQRRQSREGEHPERGQPSGGRGTERLGAGAGTTWDGGRGLCPECGWLAGRPAGRGSGGAGLRWGRGTEGLGIVLAWRRSPRLRPRDEGVSSESVFWWVHARLRA